MTPQTPKSSSTVVEPDINTPLLSPKMQTKTDRETRESGSPLGHLIDREKARTVIDLLTGGSDGKGYNHWVSGSDIARAIVEDIRIPTRCGRKIPIRAIPGTGGETCSPRLPICPACELLAFAGIYLGAGQ